MAGSEKYPRKLLNFEDPHADEEVACDAVGASYENLGEVLECFVGEKSLGNLTPAEYLAVHKNLENSNLRRH